MPRGLTAEQAEALLQRMEAVLDEHVARRQLLTYLELADRVAMPGPQRIHRTTRLLEKLVRRDLAAGRPIRAAMAISRAGSGLPAPGFFDCAKRLGMHDGLGDPRRFHRSLLEQLYGDPRVDPSPLRSVD